MIRKQSSHIPMAALVVVALVGLAAAVSTSSVVAGASSSARAPSAAALPPRPHLDPVGPAAPGSSPRPPSGARGTSPWSALINPPPFSPEAMLVLTNGTVMVQQYETGNWWRLTPSKSGSYVDGTWSQMGSLPTGYAPEYYGSAVLPDGRVVIMGGEYNGAGGPPADHGAIYNPITNKWARVNPPAGWTGIGDAHTVVLANGQLMLAQALQKIGSNIYCGGSNAALLNPTTLTWKATGTGKAPSDGCPYDEQGWTLLPNGQVLTVDTWRTTPATNTEVYTPTTGAWTSAGNTPAVMGDTNGEMGPAILRPNGTVFATGATGSNAVYNTATKTWSAGPSFPVIGGSQYDVADGPSAVLPNGNILSGASPGYANQSEHFFDFNGTSLTQVADPPGSSSLSSYDTYMVVLPTGQVLCRMAGALEVYTASGSPLATWRPKIAKVPTTLAHGGTYAVSGDQLNGLTQGASYGDDYQSATNYPLVRITNTATKHVFYARTFGMTSMSVKPGLSSSAKFTLPSGIDRGPSTLTVVANGIASAAKSVKIT